MAKQARKTASMARDSPPRSSSFDERFPAIARWISREEGWVEVGADDRSRSISRALYGGGMIWEATEGFESIDEALGAMDVGIAAWLDENRPDGWDGRQLGRESPAATPARPSGGETGPPKAPEAPERRGRTGLDGAAPALVEKVRRLAELAEALRSGRRFEITRLTSLKSLCANPIAARSFAVFLAFHARKRAVEGKADGRTEGLMDRAISGLKSHLDEPGEESEKRLLALLGEIEREQDEYRRSRWGRVRVVHCRELLVVEKALRSILDDREAPTWLYRAARDYAERYDPRFGTGLIPDSAPSVQEIADFWGDFLGS